ncbi:GerAB/ArcD/ProY family transporter [Bacillus norwichensis]|uniref:GerAB/ArcD/ProY family transporter n=1 Tax=Bacillus norwichensis TaxID=2762217 RepID=A0ABR8VI18_9BACI|nr:GerAB/ArcD/ProY family transporter [Bacillus norwichensis]MBD8004383.1 GerAB/ArcD/ProY family transporter [Bacillus norwichensis]
MNRFMYCLLFVNMIANMISAVPKVLLDHRTDGAIVSMLLSLIFGLILLYITGNFFSKYPGKDFPSLLKEYAPSWMYWPFNLLIACVWFSAGLITLVTYSFMLKRFLTPEMSITWIAISFLIVVSFGVLMNTESVLYTVENVLLLSFPLVALIIYKAFSSKQFEWDFVREAIMHFNHLPNYSSFSAATFAFVGISNMIIFNRAFTHKKTRVTWKQISLIGVIGTGVLGTLYFAPIGLNGFDHINHLVYPAISTSDTLWLKFGIIERLLYIFLPLFLAISFLNLLIHWHIAIEACKNMIWFKKFKLKKMNLTSYLYLIVFWTITLIVINSLSEHTLLLYSGYFYNIGPPLILLFFFCFWYINRRVKS